MRKPCCEKVDTNKGAWSKQEDQKLIDYIKANGEGCWRSLPQAAGLLNEKIYGFGHCIIYGISVCDGLKDCLVCLFFLLKEIIKKNTLK